MASRTDGVNGPVDGVTTTSKRRPASRRQRKCTLRHWAAVLGILALAAAACGGGGDDEQGGATGGTSEAGPEIDREATLTYVHIVLPGGFDPAQPTPSESGAHIFQTLVYDTLTRLDAESQVHPLLADSWEFAADGSYLELTLHDGVTFSNGESFDAEVVKANIERSKGLTGSISANNLAAVTTVEVIDPMTVRLNLQPGRGAGLPFILAGSAGMMIAPAALDSPDLATNPVGSGGYVVTDFQPGNQAVFERREDYWDDSEDIHNFSQITYRQIGEQTARVNAVLTGQADLAFLAGEPFTPAQQAADSGSSQLFVDQSGNRRKMMFNMEEGPLTDVLVRRAINLAINRDDVVAAATFPTEPAYQTLAPFEPGYDEAINDDLAREVDEARSLLVEAGYPDGVDLLMYVNGDEGTINAAQIVQAQLAEADIRLELQQVAPTNAYPQFAQDKPDILMARPPTFADPVQTFRVQYTGPPFFIGTPEEEFTALLAEADNPANTPEQRTDAITMLTQYVYENALDAPVQYVNAAHFGTNQIVMPESMGWSQFINGDFRFIYKTSV